MDVNHFDGGDYGSPKQNLILFGISFDSGKKRDILFSAFLCPGKLHSTSRYVRVACVKYLFLFRELYAAFHRRGHHAATKVHTFLRIYRNLF